MVIPGLQSIREDSSDVVKVAVEVMEYITPMKVPIQMNVKFEALKCTANPLSMILSHQP